MAISDRVVRIQHWFMVRTLLDFLQKFARNTTMMMSWGRDRERREQGWLIVYGQSTVKVISENNQM